MKSMFACLRIVSLIAAIVLAACGVGASQPGGGVPAPTLEKPVKPTEETAAKPAEEAMAQPTEAASTETLTKSPAWLDIQLTDVNSGALFRLSDFRGQIVLVEGMAVWCTNCLRQQRELARLHGQIGDTALSVSIDVDLNEDEALLKTHADRNGFTWRYAVAAPELAQALVDEFGSSFLNPPSVPMFLIDREGGVHLLDFGAKSVEYLIEQIEMYQ